MSGSKQIDAVALREKVDSKIDAIIEQFYRDVPFASHQKDASEVKLDYYKRHSIETVLRIRHKRMIDALVVHYFTKVDPKQAKAWAQYTEDEMLHGHMFAKDIERLFGMSMEQVLAYEPLFATKLLNGYFYFTLEHEGPMAALASAYFLEYTTRKTQPVWLDNLEKVLGTDSVRGARAHVNHDIKEDHNTFVWDVIMSTVNNEDDARRLHKHIENIYGLFAAYFLEVFQNTSGAKETTQIKSIPAAAVAYAHGASAVAA